MREEERGRKADPEADGRGSCTQQVPRLPNPQITILRSSRVAAVQRIMQSAKQKTKEKNVAQEDSLHRNVNIEKMCYEK